MAQEDEVRMIAYYIWLQEGCIDGKDCEHWTRAEAIWKEQQKSFSKNAAKKPESASASVLITPPPKPMTLLQQGNKRNIREQHKKK